MRKRNQLNKWLRARHYDACRELTEQLAEQQRKTLSHDAWLTEQVNLV